MEDTQAPSRNGNHRRLLVVDDEEKICALLTRYFSSKGYDVRSVYRGEEAVALSQAFHPHVVLLDLLMPGMSGVDTLKQLKHLTPCPKVLILSSANHEDVVQGCLDLGADFYVCKPPNLSELDHLLEGYSPPAPHL